MAKWLRSVSSRYWLLCMIQIPLSWSWLTLLLVWQKAKGSILGILFTYILLKWSHLLSCLQLLFDDHSQIPIFSLALSSKLQICKYNIRSLNKNLLNSSETHQAMCLQLRLVVSKPQPVGQIWWVVFAGPGRNCFYILHDYMINDSKYLLNTLIFVS